MDYLILKFGGVKGGDFANNPEALKKFNSLNGTENERDRGTAEIEIIDLFKGEIIIWWGQEKVGKEQAKKYILEYQSKN